MKRRAHRPVKAPGPGGEGGADGAAANPATGDSNEGAGAGASDGGGGGGGKPKAKAKVKAKAKAKPKPKVRCCAARLFIQPSPPIEPPSCDLHLSSPCDVVRCVYRVCIVCVSCVRSRKSPTSGETNQAGTLRYPGRRQRPPRLLLRRRRRRKTSSRWMTCTGRGCGTRHRTTRAAPRTTTCIR